MIRLAVICSTLATGALADSLHFACHFPNGKAVTVTHTDATATYRFGRPGRESELTITRPVADVHLTPWPGIGRTIWEEVTFFNEGHSYTLHASIERVYPDDENAEIEAHLFGGLIVRKGERELARLTCLPQTINFPWGTGLFDAKVGAGQCYDQNSRDWGRC